MMIPDRLGSQAAADLLVNHRREGAKWSFFFPDKRRGNSSAHQRPFFLTIPLCIQALFSPAEKTAWKLEAA
jgi:hypothetical protein